MNPRIGITPSLSRDALAHGSFLRYATAAPYVDAVVAAGGIPIVLPPQVGHAGPLLDAVDGLLLSGGGDVEPARYGAAETHPTVYGVSPERDRFEFDLIDAALGRDLPLLGICRGIQVLNVALGGTLIQDVATCHTGPVPVQHRQQADGLAGDAVGHEVKLLPNTALRRRFPDDTLGVNSFHHQAIATLAPALVPAAATPDGLIEAVVLPDRAFVLAVQWHPELMLERHPEQLRLFSALVEAATAHRLAGMPA